MYIFTKDNKIRYSIAVAGAAGALSVQAELWYQPIAYRWAANLDGYDAPEPKRFMGYFRSMAAGSAMMLTRANVTVQ